MPTSLFDLCVPTFLQTVAAITGFLEKAAGHFAATGIDADQFVNERLFEDMAPFHFQIEAAWHHSVWGVEALRTGAFNPPSLVGPVGFAALQATMTKAEATLESFDREEIDSTPANTSTFRSALADYPSRQNPSSSRFPCRTFTFTPSPLTTSCGREACRLEKATTRVRCGPFSLKEGVRRSRRQREKQHAPGARRPRRRAQSVAAGTAGG